MTVGRVAVEKNLEAFLSLDLPGTKVVIGTGPQEAELKRRFPDAKFLGHAGERHARRASGRRRRFRVSEPHRHVRHRAARGAGQRRSDCRFSGHRPEGRRRRPSGRRSGRGFGASPAWARWSCRATPAAPLRSNIPGKTARGSSSATPARWRPAIPARRNSPQRSRRPPTAKGGKTKSKPTEGSSMTARFRRPISTTTRSPRPTRAGRRSTTWCSARCSSAAAMPRSRRPNAVGGRILEVGVGTGISLPHYSRDLQICGVDISEPMLRKAQERVDRIRAEQCRRACG